MCIAPSTGYSSTSLNAAYMTNKGIEALISHASVVGGYTEHPEVRTWLPKFRMRHHIPFRSVRPGLL